MNEVVDVPRGPSGHPFLFDMDGKPTTHQNALLLQDLEARTLETTDIMIGSVHHQVRTVFVIYDPIAATARYDLGEDYLPNLWCSALYDHRERPLCTIWQYTSKTEALACHKEAVVEILAGRVTWDA